MRETSGSGIELQRLTEVDARVKPLHRLGDAEVGVALHSVFGGVGKAYSGVILSSFDDFCRHVTDARRVRRSKRAGD